MLVIPVDETWYAVVYDIPDDSRRTRVSAWLEGWGRRVQRSVFEFELTSAEYARMRRGLLERINGEEDEVRVYHLGRRGHRLIEAVAGAPAQPAPRWAVIDEGLLQVGDGKARLLTAGGADSTLRQESQ